MIAGALPLCPKQWDMRGCGAGRQGARGTCIIETAASLLSLAGVGFHSQESFLPSQALEKRVCSREHGDLALPALQWHVCTLGPWGQ